MWSLVRLTIVASLVGGCVLTPATPTDGARQALAPTGKLRVGINLANPVLAKRDPAGEVSGISMDLGRSMAQRLGAEFVPVLYPNPGALVEGARKSEWDIGFAAIDPARADVLLFTAAYMEVIVTYLVPADSPIRMVADADRPGVRIGVGTKNAADLYLSRSLKRAELVRVADNLDSALELVRSGKVDVFVSNRAALLSLRAKLGGYRILDERLFAVEHAIALPHSHRAGLDYARAFVEEAKTSGEVARSIARRSIAGVEVAPPAKDR